MSGQIKIFTLKHLFTPSGLHLTSFLYLFFYLRRFNFFFFFILLIINFLANKVNLPLYSLQRVAFLGLTKEWFKLSRFKMQNFNVFLLCFMLEFYLGTYQLSQISFAYSFLFLGIIFASLEEKRSIIYPLLFGQIFISILQLKSINLISMIYGLIITSVFTLYFPLMLLGLFIHLLFEFNFIDYLTNSFNDLVKIAYKYRPSGGLPTHFGMLIILMINFTNYSSKIKKMTIFIILTFYPYNLENLSKGQLKDYPRKSMIKNKGRALKIKKLKYGYKVKYDTKLICKYKLLRYNYKETCTWKKLFIIP